MTSTDPTSRTLALLGLLQPGRPWSGAELAARLGVSTRTIRRDVERLRGLGYQVQTRPGPGGEYRLRAGASLPPLFFDEDEVVALVAGLRMIEPHLQQDGAAERALTKLAWLLPDRLASLATGTRDATEIATDTAPVNATSTTPPSTLSTTVLTQLARASADSGRVSFTYRDQHGRASQRTVDPHQIVLLRGHWYLLGYDLDREARRTLRLDRVTEVERRPGHFRRRSLPTGSALEYLLSDFGRRADASPRAASPADRPVPG